MIKFQISNFRFQIMAMLMCSLAYGQGKQAIYVDTKTHKVLAPARLAGNDTLPDFDFSLVTVAGISGGGGGGISDIPIGKSLYVDGVNGSDNTGVRGQLDKPFATVSGAVAAATPGDTIYIGPGTFTETTPIQLPANTSLLGAGRDTTKIVNATTIVSSGHAAVALGTGSLVADLTIDGSTGTNATATAPIGALTNDVAFTSATVRDCTIVGNAAGFYFAKAGAGGLRVYNTRVITTWDTIFSSTGGPYDFYNCEFTSDGSVISGAVTASGVNCAGGTVRLFNGQITITSQPSPSGLRTGGGTVEGHNIRVAVTGTGTPLDVNNGSGTIGVDDVTRPDGALLVQNGTVTPLERTAVGVIYDPGDNTKQLTFDVHLFPTATTRTISPAPGGNSVTVIPMVVGTPIVGTPVQPERVLGINTDGTVAYGYLGTTAQNSLGASVNNWNLSVGTAYYQLWSSTVAVNVTGISITQQNSESFHIINNGTNNITIKHESASSTAANRFNCSTGADIILGANAQALAIYDSGFGGGGIAARWRVIPLGATAAAAGLGYVMDGGFFGAFSPLDSTTYFIGYGESVATVGHTTYANCSMIVPKAGTIKRVHFTGAFNNNGSNEAVSHYLRLNDTTDTTLSTTETYDPGANTRKDFIYTGLSITVNAGDTIAFKIVAPAWATNPTFFNNHLLVYIE